MVRMLSSTSLYILGDNHSQCAAPNPVLKWTLHHFDFTVESNPHAFARCLYPHLVRTKLKEIFVVAQTSDRSTQRQGYQFQTTGCVGYVNAQLALIKTITRSDIEQVHCILVVTDKHKGSGSIE